MGIRVLPDVFTVTRRAGCVTAGVVAAGGYFDVNPHINNTNFPIRCAGPDLRMIKLLECDSLIYHLEVFAAAAGFGLFRPEYEDALFLGEKQQFPEKLEKKLLVFLHEPWGGLRSGDCVSHIVICLYGTEGNGGVVERRLALDWERRKWPPGTIFPFIMERRGSRRNPAVVTR